MSIHVSNSTFQPYSVPSDPNNPEFKMCYIKFMLCYVGDLSAS